MNKVFCLDSFSTRLTVVGRDAVAGSLNGKVSLTRCGVFDYLDPRTPEEGGTGGIIRVARLPEYVLAKSAQDSLKRLPFQVEHVEFLTPDNMAEFKVGNTGSDVFVDGEEVVADFTIDDVKGIAAIDAGKDGVSCGYYHGLVFQPGSYKGMAFDAYQTDYEYNHVALCADPRLGDDLRLEYDSAKSKPIGASTDSNRPRIMFRMKAGDSSTTPSTRENNMKKISLDGTTFIDVADEVAAHIAKQAKDAADAKTAADAALQAEKDAHGATKDLLQAEKDALPAKIKAAVAERSALDTAIAKFVPEAKRAALKDAAAIDCKKAVISAWNPALTLDGKSEAAIDTLFEAAVTDGKPAEDAAAAARAAAGGQGGSGSGHQENDADLLAEQRKALTGMATEKATA